MEKRWYLQPWGKTPIFIVDIIAPARDLKEARVQSS
jgi:hypothetical protein